MSLGDLKNRKFIGVFNPKKPYEWREEFRKFIGQKFEWDLNHIIHGGENNAQFAFMAKKMTSVDGSHERDDGVAHLNATVPESDIDFNVGKEYVNDLSNNFANIHLTSQKEAREKVMKRMDGDNIEPLRPQRTHFNEMLDDFWEVLKQDKYQGMSAAEIYGVVSFFRAEYLDAWMYDE